MNDTILSRFTWDFPGGVTGLVLAAALGITLIVLSYAFTRTSLSPFRRMLFLILRLTAAAEVRPETGQIRHAAETGGGPERPVPPERFSGRVLYRTYPGPAEEEPADHRMRKRIHQRPFRLSRTSSMTSSSDRSGFQPVKA